MKTKALSILFLGIFSFSIAHADDSQTIKLGFLPIFSPETLVKLHKPLKDQLENKLGINVQMISAPNFKAFRERTESKSYDLIFTAPHLARLAEKKDNYKRVVATAHRGSANFLSRKDSDITEIDKIKGKRLALPPKSAIIHFMALKTLRDRGFMLDNDVTIVTTKTHNDPVLRLLAKQVDVAAIGKAPWAKMKEKAGDQVAVFAQSVTIPGFMIMANPNIQRDILKKSIDALLDFNDTPEGIRYLTESGYKALIPISNEDMDDMDLYVNEMFEK